MQWVLVVVISVAATAVFGDEECRPKPGEKMARSEECCKVTDLIPATLEDAMKKCADKFSPPKMSGPPSGPPTKEMKNTFACMAECMFEEEKLLTADKQVDKAAVMKYFKPKNADLAPVMSAAIEKCFSSYMADVDPTLECKSGVSEFKRCMKREVFLNCPSSVWTSSTDCDDLKDKVEKCPKMPVFAPKPPPK